MGEGMCKAGKSIDNVLETIRTMYYNELMKESQINKVNDHAQELRLKYKSFKMNNTNQRICENVVKIGKWNHYIIFVYYLFVY